MSATESGHDAGCEREYTENGFVFIDCLCHIRRAKADAWDEGHRFTGYDPERGENPYRSTTSDSPDGRPIPPAGTVIEVEGGMEFVSNGFVWLGCTPGDDATVYPAWTPEKMNKWRASGATARTTRRRSDDRAD